MCGIVGIMGDGPVAPRLLDGLKRLEYRGYDSAGIATLTPRAINRRRASGKLFNLAKLINDEPLGGSVGIGHTRWATHGEATVSNAHPHASETVVLVHNGIIENSASLKEKLMAQGVRFNSDTDTEVIVHLITQYLEQGLTPLAATQKTLADLEGAYALVILFRDYPDLMIGVRKGSPLVFGMEEREFFFGSDVLAIAPWSKQVIYLENGDLAVARKDEAALTYTIYDEKGNVTERPIQACSLTQASVSKGAFSHYMLKEIFEQPQTLSDTLQALFSLDENTATLRLPPIAWERIKRIRIVACGTSYYAGLVATHWFEQVARIPTQCEIASEFRYRDPVLTENDLSIFISQSGETIDTLAALTLVNESGGPSVALVNVAESSIARAATHVVQTLAGPEIGVASTKAFTAQLAALAVMVIQAAKAQGRLSSTQVAEQLKELTHLPRLVQAELTHDEKYRFIAHSLTDASTVLYLARGIQYPIALEGALKLKELSYIHAEGYAAGELKHGPIALIDKGTPVIILMPSDAWFEKTYSNMEQVLARGAHVICITDAAGNAHIQKHAKEAPIQTLVCESSSFFISPILYSLPIQLLAYYTALHKGTDVDQPRNLAKSVTVE